MLHGHSRRGRCDDDAARVRLLFVQAGNHAQDDDPRRGRGGLEESEQARQSRRQEDEADDVITEDELRETSESFKRSIAHKRISVEEIDES